MINRILHGALLGVFLLGSPAAASGGDTALDPALRVLLSHPEDRIPGLARTAAEGAGRGALPAAVIQGQPLLDTGQVEVFLEARGPLAIPDASVSVDLGDGILAVRLPVNALRKLIEDGALASARLSRPVYPTLDRSTAYLGLSRIRTQDPETGRFHGATGRGVVVGSVDSGVDWSHPDFDDASGRTRIFRYWDQRARSNSPPADFPFGLEYGRTAIDNGAAGSIDREGHGTHVLGIAAGNGRGSLVPGQGARYAGVAPEATLIVVRTQFTEFGVVVGAQYLFDRARLAGLPAVLNLSLGNQFGPHRGTTPFERALDDLVGPGHLIVAAAGNDGARAIHAEMRPSPEGVQTLEIEVPDYTKNPEGITFAYLEGWFPASNRYRFTVVSPQGDRLGSFEYGDLDRVFQDVKGFVRGWVTEDQGLGNLMLEIEDDPASFRRAGGVWKVEVLALEPMEDPEIDFWIAGWNGDVPGTYPVFRTYVDADETIISPAAAPHILAVGAISTRTCWTGRDGQERCYADPPAYGEVAFFSSRGPTADGRNKPEILAPGFGVVSALSSGFTPTVQNLDVVGTPDGLYWLNQGTSMAAPHAAGTVALLLERYPELTYKQAVGRLERRGQPLVDSRTGRTEVAMRTGESVLRIVDLDLDEVVPDRAGVRLRWFVGKEREPVSYRVYKGFADEGPYYLLSAIRLTGDRAFELLDRNVEPGRRHVYRIAAADGEGLEDDLDTLRIDVPGVPRLEFRPPDPNPARTAAQLRFFVPPSAKGGRARLDVLDLQGRRIRSLETDPLPAEGAERVVSWNLRDDAGRRVPGGVYFVRLRVAVTSDSPRSAVRRVVVLP